MRNTAMSGMIEISEPVRTRASSSALEPLPPTACDDQVARPTVIG
jgi:hypothetical protein